MPLELTLTSGWAWFVGLLLLAIGVIASSYITPFIPNPDPTENMTTDQKFAALRESKPSNKTAEVRSGKWLMSRASVRMKIEIRDRRATSR